MATSANQTQAGESFDLADNQGTTCVTKSDGGHGDHEDVTMADESTDALVLENINSAPAQGELQQHWLLLNRGDVWLGS